MVDQCLFLLEALAWVDNNTFPFQQHLKATCDLLPPSTCACLPPFEQFIKQQMVELQDSILERLHHHTLSNMFFDKTSKAHCAQILSSSSLKANVWLTTQPIFPTFELSSLVFCTSLHMQLGLPHPSIICMLQCVCTHPIDPMGIHFLHSTHVNKHIRTHDLIRDTFVAIVQDVGFHVRWKQLHALPSTTFNSSCQRINIVFTKDDIRTLFDVVNVDPTQADLFPRSCTTQWFVVLNVAQAKERSYCDWHSVDPFLPLAIEVFGTCWCVFTQLSQCHLGLEGDKRPSSLYLGHFSS